MNPIGKKFLSLFLVFSLMMLSVNLYGKERRGAKLLITKKDGQQVEGELITAKPNSLLLLDTEGKDVSVDIEEIKVIRVKKSGASLGAGIGGAIGLGVGLYVPISSYCKSVNRGEDVSLIFPILLGSLILPVAWIVGVAIGWGVGALVRVDDVIYLTGMTDSEIQDALDKLRKKARIRDYK